VDKLLDKGGVALALMLTLVAGIGVAGEAPEGMVRIPAGAFTMGADASDGRVGIEVAVDSVPRHTRTLPAYWIDRTEVTNAAYREFVAATGREAPADPRFAGYFAWKEGEFPAGLDNHPVVYVDWTDARNYCAWAGKRLPSEAEWEKAARGTDGRRYPWGNEFSTDRCNTRDAEFGWTVPVGTLDGDMSPYGVMDMCGNVAEWVEDWYRGYPGSDLERASFGETLRGSRGGSWMLPGEVYARVTNRTMASPPDKKHRSMGFRCALSVDGDGAGD